jgi:hypothetical protein
MRCLTPRFQTIAEAVSKLPCRMESLELNGKDLRELPLTDRRQHLNKLLARTETVIYPVPSFDRLMPLPKRIASSCLPGVPSLPPASRK